MLKIILIVILLLLLAEGALIYFSTDRLAQFGALPEGERLKRIKSSPNSNGREFFNHQKVSLNFGLGDYWAMTKRYFSGDEVRTPEAEIPVVKRAKADYSVAPESGLRVTWLGHSTALLEIDGAVVLTDPVWAERASPSRMFGPKRFHPPPLALADLPRLDAVIISHDHFDHLDKDAVIALARTGVGFVTPLGVGSHLESWGIKAAQITELDWSESHTTQSGLILTATPSLHFSGRGLIKKNRTLWASWALKGPVHRVFFSSDMGTYDRIAEIGTEHGPFDLTLIEVGAYNKLWPEVHLTPEAAVRAHQDLRGDLFIPIHWGTFNLAFHGWRDPPDRALAEAERTGVRIAIPKPGQIVEPASPPTVETWWREVE